MIATKLKLNLLISLVVLNLGLIFTILLIENYEINSISTLDLKTIIAYGLTLFGLLYFISSISKIIQENKGKINAESSDLQDF